MHMSPNISNGQIIKTWNKGSQTIKAVQSEKSILFSVIENGHENIITEDLIEGFPANARNSIEVSKAFLSGTYLTTSKLGDGSYKLYIMQGGLGGANIINPKREFGKLWKNGVIPYEIDIENYPVSEIGRAEILAGIQIWNIANTGFRLIPRTSERDYVVFGEDPEACYSNVGRVGKKQYINCHLENRAFNKGSIAHEIGHVIGFFHEHMRSDRDNYVTVLSSDKNNYAKKSEENVFGKYDFDSIMHYPYRDNEMIEKKFVKDYFTGSKSSPGQRENLSSTDIAAAKYLYRFIKNNDSYIPENANLSPQELQKESAKPVYMKLYESGVKFFKNRDFSNSQAHFSTLLSEYSSCLRNDAKIEIQNYIKASSDIIQLLNRNSNLFHSNSPIHSKLFAALSYLLQNENDIPSVASKFKYVIGEIVKNYKNSLSKSESSESSCVIL